MGRPGSESRPFAGDHGFALNIPLRIKERKGRKLMIFPHLKGLGVTRVFSVQL